ncbi:unnamed protein product [Rhizoctonia solani]|uniref:Uncharacterized protein n=1 Tax=Rhizoctonia solani TaxID=456999 RepID=A0A8H3HI78_9AGAM|nr:unnamed protein product [Rhizoctonia solani]
MQHNGRRVIGIPELLNSIVYRLSPHKQRELMRVSKYFFSSIGPMAWRKIPGFDIILRLVRGAKGKTRKVMDTQGIDSFKQITITLPSNPNLTRYNVYAPWVQELEIFAGHGLEIHNDGPFLTRLGGRPPLPNLTRLTARTGADIDSREMTSFLSMFICPSLIEIRTIIYKRDIYSYLEPFTVRTFLEKIQETCPEIQVLEFYPGRTYECPEGYKPGDRCRSLLRSFSNLRHFGSSSYILEPTTFAIIGNLPHLQLLGIRGFDMENPVLDEEVSIPETWFPVLESLRLYDVHPQDIKALWKHPPVVKKLVSVSIRTDPTTASDIFDDSMDGNEWIEAFLTALPHMTPGLKNLRFHVADEEGTRFQISQNARDGLSDLGLESLKLKVGNPYGVDKESEDEAYFN